MTTLSQEAYDKITANGYYRSHPEELIGKKFHNNQVPLPKPKNWEDSKLIAETKGKPICIIPARAGSKRLKNKNKLPLNGKPMFMYAVEAALESGIFERVILTTNDVEIIKTAYEKRIGLTDKSINLLINYRPRMLCQDDVQVKTVCQYILNCYKTPHDVFAVLIPCNPFITAEDIRNCYDLVFKRKANYIMSVKRCPPLQWAVRKEGHHIVPFMGHEYLKRTQDLDQLYIHDGGIIFANVKTFYEEIEMDFHGSKCYPYFMKQSLDIDTKEDYEYAKFLIENHA